MKPIFGQLTFSFIQTFLLGINYLRMEYVLSSAALINAKSPQQPITLEPPQLTNGKVTPVSGRMSVAPKMLSES